MVSIENALFEKHKKEIEQSINKRLITTNLSCKTYYTGYNHEAKAPTFEAVFSVKDLIIRIPIRYGEIPIITKEMLVNTIIRATSKREDRDKDEFLEEAGLINNL